MTLQFVNPDEAAPTYRVMLWAAPGEGKSVAAASAPGPVLVLSADRPTAYRFARRYHAPKEIRETRYVDANSLPAVYNYLASSEGEDVRTLIVDPVSSIYDKLVETGPRRSDGDPDYQAVNATVMSFITNLRKLDVNVVLVAHEKLNDGKKGDGKLYPAAGGPSLTEKILREMDIVARVERRAEPTDAGGEEIVWVAQLQPTPHVVCKESTGFLGDRRRVDLAEWFATANKGYDLPPHRDDREARKELRAVFEGRGMPRAEVARLTHAALDAVGVPPQESLDKRLRMTDDDTILAAVAELQPAEPAKPTITQEQLDAFSDELAREAADGQAAAHYTEGD